MMELLALGALTSAGAALLAAGRPSQATLFGLVYLINRSLVYIWAQ